MELQIYQFWILKEHHDKNDFSYKFEPDLLNTCWVICVWKGKILQRMYGIISGFATKYLFNRGILRIP